MSVSAHALARRDELVRVLRGHAPLAVAYSGGVDSTYLLAEARQTLGDRVLGVIADSASLPRAALDSALRVAAGFGARVEVVQTRELDDPRYAANPENRCYFCKAELFQRMDLIAKARGFAAIAYGENADDPAHLRPGSVAAAKFAVVAPLREAGLTKRDIRELSARIGLPTANAPAQPCLSSRIPHGTPVTRNALALVERGEAAVRALGFRVFRVRLLPGDPPRARLFTSPDELREALGKKADICGALVSAGFADAAVDPDGYHPPGT